MTILTKKAPGRDGGTWPDGEPESVREAADARTTSESRAVSASDLRSEALKYSHRPACGLIALAQDLLQQASELVQPSDVHVSERDQRIGFQFESGLPSHGALWQWADLFGYTVEMSRASRKGRRLVSMSFTYYGVAVEAYAYI
jgi:hypothetical protein